MEIKKKKSLSRKKIKKMLTIDKYLLNDPIIQKMTKRLKGPKSKSTLKLIEENPKQEDIKLASSESDFNSLDYSSNDNEENSEILANNVEDKKNSSSIDLKKLKRASEYNMQRNQELNENKNQEENEIIKTSEEINRKSSENSQTNLDINIFYEGKTFLINVNKNEFFKSVYNKIHKKLLPFYNLDDYDILYKLKIIDLPKYQNTKIKEILTNITNEEIPSFLLSKKINKEIIKNQNKKGTTVKIENFPSFTDLAIDLNIFFQKENRESNFTIDYNSNNICKIIFDNPEKAISLVLFLTKLKAKKPIYKRLKVKLDYKIKIDLNSNKCKSKELKLILPTINQNIINEIKNNKVLFTDSRNTLPKKTHNLKFILPDINLLEKKKVYKIVKRKEKEEIRKRNRINSFNINIFQSTIDYADHSNKQNEKSLEQYNKINSSKKNFLKTGVGFNSISQPNKTKSNNRIIKNTFDRKFSNDNLYINKVDIPKKAFEINNSLYGRDKFNYRVKKLENEKSISNEPDSFFSVSKHKDTKVFLGTSRINKKTSFDIVNDRTNIGERKKMLDILPGKKKSKKFIISLKEK